MKKYQHISLEERKAIEKLYKKMRIVDLAEFMERSATTIYRELQRCPEGKYNAKEANADAVRRSNSIEETGKQRGRVPKSRLVKTCFQVSPGADPVKVSEVTGVPLEDIEKIRKELNAN